ncbi:MAG: type II toxin-antitoxin system VapC family toxin [Terriglobales bacterium]|jgi:PIN domain nuclease of toxin-antitoxin system
MRILIDTHVFLWGLTEEARLSQAVRTLLPVADVWMSVAGIWEIITKVQVGKLTLPSPVGPFLTAKLAANGVSVLPITLNHVLRIESLELHHRDPFDRVLIAQSIEEKLPLVTADPHFERYPVEIIW